MNVSVAYAIAAAVCLTAGWFVPALVMRALAPTLRGSRLRATNYRGRTVFLGLGLVWVVWVISLMVASTAFDVVRHFVESSPDGYTVALFEGPLTLPLYGVPLMLVGISVLLGFMDDLFGTHDDKGFHGHLSALSSGRLTTGGLKALGIGAISAVYAWHIAQGRSAAASGWMETVGTWLLATLVIALSANFINLMDLRPGRALKVYSLLIVIAAPLFAVDASRAFSVYASSLAELGVAPWLSVDTLLAALLMVLVLLGPVAAVWRFDLGEEGMLGDAGSNVMGAIVGYLLASALPLEWMAAAAAALLALNVLSERVSYSAVIERVAPLRALDRLGRLTDEAAGVVEAEGGEALEEHEA
jgi:hypothetical protein